MNGKPEAVPLPSTESPALDLILSKLTDLSTRLEKVEAKEPAFRPTLQPFRAASPGEDAPPPRLQPGQTFERVKHIPLDKYGRRATAPPVYGVRQRVRIDENSRHGTAATYKRVTVKDGLGRVISVTETELRGAERQAWKPAQPFIGAMIEVDGKQVQTMIHEDRVLKTLTWKETIDRLGDGGMVPCQGTVPGMSESCGQPVRVGSPCESCGETPWVMSIPSYSNRNRSYKYICRVQGLTSGVRGDGFYDTELLPA